MGKIEAVIFDWGGVLIEDPALKLAKYCSKSLGVGLNEYQQAYRIYMDDLETGRITELQFWNAMTNHLGVSMPHPGAPGLWGDAFANAYIPRKEIFTLAAKLRKTGCKTAILSNTEKPSVEFFYKQNYDMFDVTVFSCLEGIMKPEREIYEIALDRLGTPAGETIFIDDRQEYINGAKEIGLKTILFKNINQLKKELTKAIGRIDDGFCGPA
jgi:putative hydrolase of the HAD superfamily